MDAIEAIKLLKGMRVFVTSRERIKQPEGHDLFDKAIETLEAAESVAQGGEVPLGWLISTEPLETRGYADLWKDKPQGYDHLTMVPVYTRTIPATGSGGETFEAFQVRVSAWMGKCFIPSIVTNLTERGDRFLEESLEKLQAHGYDPARIPTLVDYVWSRPIGEPAQESGGVMVTLAAYDYIAKVDLADAAWNELRRIEQPCVMDKIRAKQEAKNALHFDTPLPGQVCALTAKPGAEGG